MNKIKSIIFSYLTTGNDTHIAVNNTREIDGKKFIITRIEQAHLCPNEGINRWFFVYGMTNNDEREYMLNAWNPLFVAGVEYYLEGQHGE